jgi:hypothetical protein
MRLHLGTWLSLGVALMLPACGPNGSSPTIGGSTLEIQPALALVSTPWPGSQEVRAVDPPGVLGKNIRGLHYNPFSSNVVWAVRSKPGALLKLIWNGTNLVPDVAAGFNPDKLLRYPNGTGNPAVQGVTWDDEDTYPFLVVANRDNDHPGVKRSSILNYPPSGPGLQLTAGQEWNLTADLPHSEPDRGAKAVQWAPVVNLWFNGLYDEAKGRRFNPSDYANATAGIIFVGWDNGSIHAYVLHPNSTYTRIQTIESGLPHVTALDFRKDFELWAACDNRCQGRTAILELDSSGRFVPTQRYDRPAGMPNLDNEGFAHGFGSCTVFWSDVRSTHDQAIRIGSRCPTSGLLAAH